MPAQPPSSLCPETKSGSLLHWLAGYGRPGKKPRPLWVIYLVAAGLAYLPPLIAAALGHRLTFVPQSPLVKYYSDAPLHDFVPFLEDWGLAYGLLISFPALLLMYLTDERVLSTSLRQVQRDEVIVSSGSDAETLPSTWEPKFRRANIWSQGVGIVGGIALGLLTLLVFIRPAGESWMVHRDHLGLLAYAYAFAISLLYAMVIIYVWRCVTMSKFLRALVKAAPLHLLPFHPDKCGGLRPVGQIGLRNQYTLTVLGINIVLLILVWTASQNDSAPLTFLMMLVAMAFLILGPVVFMAPLLPFRRGMLDAKSEWTSEIAHLLRKEFAKLRKKIRKEEITKSDEETIDRLRKVGEVIDDLPVWPFDARTLRRFATAYLIPIGIPLGQVLLDVIKKP